MTRVDRFWIMFYLTFCTFLGSCLSLELQRQDLKNMGISIIFLFSNFVFVWMRTK